MSVAFHACKNQAANIYSVNYRVADNETVRGVIFNANNC